MTSPTRAPDPLTRVWSSPHPVNVAAILGILRQGGADPAYRHDPDGTIWRAVHTPCGPGTLAVRARPGDGQVTGRAWGPGAQWLLDGLPELLGEGDDDAGFVAHHEVVAGLRRRFAGWRVPRSRLVIDALVPTVIAQKVTGQEAFAGYARLVRRFGEPAPGPRVGLMTPPTVAGWRAVPSWAWLAASVDGARSRPIQQALRVAGRLEECVRLTHGEAAARLMAVPGIGRWTAAEVAQRALGDPDSVSVGDYHVARNIGWVLIGRETTDEEILELLEPYAGHRYRVQRLIELAGLGRPRRGPRMALRSHLPVTR